MMCAENGAISLGFSTIVQPAASAGATLQAIWFAGQFHGVMRPHTPTGSRTTPVVPCIFSNSKSFRTPSATMKWPRPDGACSGVGDLRERRAHLLGDRLRQVGEPASCRPR